MKKFLKTSVLAFGFGLVFYILALGITGVIRPAGVPNVQYYIGGSGHMYTRVQEIPQNQDVDILVLGSSRAYRGIDPRIFGAENITLYNLGSSAQTASQSFYLAQRYFDVLRPKLVLVEVYPKGFSSDGVESALDIIANDELNKSTLEMALEINHLKVYNALVVGFIRDLIGIDDHFSEPVRREDETYISGGYVEKDLEFNPEPGEVDSLEFAFRPEQVQALVELVEFIRERGAEVVLFEAPCAPRRYESIVNRDEMEEVHRELATYVNFNERLELNDSLHFYDRSHLNIHGVKIFNGAMIAWLEKEGYPAKLKTN